MRLISFKFAALLAIALLPLTVQSSAADLLPAPSASPVLTVSGELEIHNSGQTAQFDMTMLQAMETVEIATTTIWTEGPQTFTGVPLKHLLDRLEITQGEVAATALNDYAVKIPMAEISDTAPIIAYEMNGQPMSRRDKGPLWVVYPYDDGPAYRTETVYSRSIWQLDRLVVTQ